MKHYKFKKMPEVNLLSIPQFTPSQTSNRLMTQVMCTRVNHIFSGVGTKKKKSAQNPLKNVKSEDSTYKQQEKIPF